VEEFSSVLKGSPVSGEEKKTTTTEGKNPVEKDPSAHLLIQEKRFRISRTKRGRRWADRQRRREVDKRKKLTGRSRKVFHRGIFACFTDG